MSSDRSVLLFEVNPCPMLQVDPGALTILAVNDAAVGLYGYSREEFLVLSLPDLEPTGDAPPARPARPEGGAPGPIAVRAGRHQRNGGALMDVEISTDAVVLDGRSVWLVAVRDLSERTRLEEQLRQAQKVDAVGRLTGGVAHDFNNLLTAILGYSELALAAIHEDAPHRRYVEQVCKAGERAAALTKRLLTFSRKHEARMDALDLNAVIRDIQPMLRRLIGENIEIRAELAPDLGQVLADPHAIEQVVMNLVVNARDAMASGGTLTIRTANADSANQVSAGVPASWAAPVALLSVTDTGCGMSDEVQARIFEPFFTTKDAGKGTGLGLATVFGIVGECGGRISVSSSVGAGTTMSVRFPRIDGQRSTARDLPPVRPATGAVASAKILVVDDDEVVRELAATVLAREGHSVLTAATAEEACRLAEGHAGDVGLLLADVVLPGTSGRALARWLETLYPELKVVYMSGYDDSVLSGHGIAGDNPAVLRKPFTSAALVESVRSALHA